MFTLIIVFTSVFLYIIYNKYGYWNRKGINGPKPWPIVGNYGPVLFQIVSETQLIQSIYKSYPNEKVIGIYKGLRPVLLVRDPEVIKSVLIKDFDHFRDRYITYASKNFQKSMYVMDGDVRWKIIRQTFLSSFTKIKIAKMMPKVYSAVENYTKFVDDMVKKEINYESKQIAMNYTLEAILDIVLGVKMDAFADESNFKNFISKLICLELQAALRTLEMICPSIGYVTKICGSNLYKGIRQYMIPHLESLNIRQNEDMTLMDILLKHKIKGKIENKVRGKTIEVNIDDDDIVQQAATFCMAGIEFGSGGISFTLFELAYNPLIQDKCYEEICTILDKNNGEFNLDAISEMKYLEMAFTETMRKYSLTVLDRICTIHYKVPGTEVVIDKGTCIYIPAHAIHNDSKYYPDPDTYDPERFSIENRAKYPQCVYLPFGNGPRQCIGQRIGKMVVLVGLAAFLRKFRVVPSDFTANRLMCDPTNRARMVLGGIWLKVERRDQT